MLRDTTRYLQYTQQVPPDPHIGLHLPGHSPLLLENHGEPERHTAHREKPPPFQTPTTSSPLSNPPKESRPFQPRDIPSSPNFCRSRRIIPFRAYSIDEIPKPIPLNDKTKPARSPFSPRHKPITMVSLAPFVLKRPWLTKMLTPAANWYANAAGYRQLGLRYETATNLL